MALPESVEKGIMEAALADIDRKHDAEVLAAMTRDDEVAAQVCRAIQTEHAISSTRVGGERLDEELWRTCVRLGCYR